MFSRRRFVVASSPRCSTRDATADDSPYGEASVLGSGKTREKDWKRRGKLREKGCAGETERAGGRERAGAREIHQQESGRGTRSRSSPVRTRSPALTGEVVARPPPSRAAACVGCGHVPPISADLQHLEERGKQETQRGGGGAVVENVREGDAAALERGLGVRERKQEGQR